MLRPSLIACAECACHVRSTEETCPHCGAALVGAAQRGTDVRKVKRAAVAVSLGLAVSVAQLAACDDVSGTGGAGGSKASSTGSGTSSISAYGTGATSPTVGSTTGSDSSSISAYGTGSTFPVGSSGSGTGGAGGAGSSSSGN